MKPSLFERANCALPASFAAVRGLAAAALIATSLAACDVHSMVEPGGIVSISVTPNTTLAISGTQQFTAIARDADGREVAFTPAWTVESGGGAIGNNGMFTAGTALGVFNATIRASSGGVFGTANVTVIAGPVAVITVSPNPQTLPINGVQQFTAAATDAGGNPVPITPTWSVAAGGGTINAATGLFTAGTTTGTFNGTIRASSDGQFGTATVVVLAGPAATIAVTPNPHTLPISGVQQFTATAADAGGNPVAIAPVWSIAAGGGTIDASGRFTAGTMPGTYTNTVRATSGQLVGAATVTVTAGPAASITVTPNPRTLQINGVEQFTATATDAAGNPVQISPSWAVVAGGGSIDGNGVFTAGAASGTFANTVRATSGAASGSATITVIGGAPAAITVTPNPRTLAINGTQQFTATAVDAGGNAVPISPVWSVTNGGGTIDSGNGTFTAGTTTGTFNNTVRATAGGVSGTATVTVTTGPLATITVTPNPRNVPANGTQQFLASGRDAGNNPVPITPVWTVVNGGGTINATTGMFTAGGVAGTFGNTVRATAGGVFGSATVTVTAAAPPPPPTGIFGSAAPNGIMAGTAVTCVALGMVDADVSIHPGMDNSGFPPCVITGVKNFGNAVAAQAQMDLTAAFNTLAGMPCPADNAIVANLGGTTKAAGVYCSATGIGVTGTLTLDGGGDPNAQFVFQAGSSLTTAGNIVLINGAQARNVFWLVGSSATIGTASQWQGNIVALTSITLVDNANLIGRALARNGAVTLGTNNTIILP